MILVECNCGTLYHLKSPLDSFRCGKCHRVVKTSPPITPMESKALRERALMSLSRWVFLIGCTVGLFTLLLTLPTAVMLENPIILLVLELMLGTLLVCVSFAMYLLTIQVQSMQFAQSLHMNNLRIFADQIMQLRHSINRRRDQS